MPRKNSMNMASRSTIVAALFSVLFVGNFACYDARPSAEGSNVSDNLPPLLSARRSILNDVSFADTMNLPGAYPPAPPGVTTVHAQGFSPDLELYNVQLSADRAIYFEINCSPEANVAFLTPTKAAIWNIKPSTKYSCEARGVGKNRGVVGPWTAFSFTTPRDSPGSVVILSQSFGKNFVTFRISAEWAKTFSFSCSAPSVPSVNAAIIEIQGVPNTADAKLVNLKPATTYTCKTRAIGRSGVRGPEKVVTFRTAPLDQNLPSIVAMRSVVEKPTSAVITTTRSYRAKTHGARCYSLASPFSVVKSSVSTGASVVTVTVSNLHQGSKYACDIYGTNEWGSGKVTRVTFETKIGAPAPVRINGIDVSSKTAVIRTTKSPSAVSYDAKCWNAASDPKIPVVVIRRTSDSSGLKFSLSNLRSKTSYACRIVSIGKNSVVGGTTMTGPFTTK